jgi:hypothetical protein
MSEDSTLISRTERRTRLAMVRHLLRVCRESLGIEGEERPEVVRYLRDAEEVLADAVWILERVDQLKE